MVFFYLVITGWIFYIISLYQSINQSKWTRRLFVVAPDLLSGHASQDGK